MVQTNSLNLLKNYQDGSGFVIPPQILDVDASALKYLHSRHKNHLIYGFIVSLFYEFLIVNWLFFQTKLEDVRLLILLLLPVVVYFSLLNSIRSRMFREFYKQFAAANGFSYAASGNPELETGAIFSVGHSAKIYDYITGSINNLPIKLFNYSYTVGSGKSSRFYSNTVWSINFFTPLPPMMLLCDRHFFGDNLSDNNLKNSYKVSLPEDLEKKFNLFTETKFEIEALQIFSPNFLYLLHQKYPNFSLDFTGSQLYIYAGSTIKKRADLELLKDLVVTITKHLGEKLPAMSGSIVALNEAITKAPESSNFNQIFNSGSSSRMSSTVTLIAFGILMALLASFLFGVLN